MAIILGLVLLAALMLPILSVVLDSPFGRALARRVDGPEAAPPPLAELAKRVELLEGEVDDLSRAVEGLKDENAFLQRLIEDAPARPALPPRSGP
jgi:hypothetical protein